MPSAQSTSLVALRILTGCFFFYAGISKVFAPAWSAAGYLMNAKTFAGLYAFFAQPGILPLVNFMNKWGLVLLGLSLIFGVGMRISTWLGSALMALYYFPILTFPYIDHGFIVDTHIILIAVLTVLRQTDQSREFGLKKNLEHIGSIRKSKMLQALIR